jgi:FkbM family methyltransferase
MLPKPSRRPAPLGLAGAGTQSSERPWAARGLMSDPAGRSLLSATLNEDARFLYPSSDEYWAAGVTVGDRLYEPEIDWLLHLAAERPYSLIDCGANLGYWAIVASSRPYGRHPAVAIEASRANFELLVMNARANGDRFQVLHRAILDESGKQVTLYGRRHYGMSLLKSWHPDDSDRFETVETITIDEIAERYVVDRRHPALIKLDVEGSEIEAMMGGHRMREEGALFAYEDHGKEPSHRVSRFVLSLGNVDVWHVGADFRPTRIASAEQLGPIKSDSRMGYNFFACLRTSPWASIFADRGDAE